MTANRRASLAAAVLALAAAVLAQQAGQPVTNLSSDIDVVLSGAISSLPGDPTTFKVLVFQQLKTGW
jgi:hypothetical protein